MQIETRRERLFSYAGTIIGILCLITTASAAAAESPYGLSLRPQKVEGIDSCMAVEVVGNQLFAIGRGELHILDISQPGTPRPLGKLSDLGNTRQIVIREKTAYITSRQDGLWLVDISDPAAPELISHYDTVEMATGIWVSGKIAFVATRCYGVEIVDVSDPKKPLHLSILKTGEAQSCWARDGILYIGDWAPKKLILADVRNPRKPKIIGEAELDGYGDGGCLRGDYCFAATGHHSRAKSAEESYGQGHGLEIFNVADPQNPEFVSRVKFPPSYQITNDMWEARVAGNYCVVADTWNGLFVVNIEDITQPEIVGHAVLPPEPKNGVPDPVGGIALGDGVIYAGGIFTGLYVIPAQGFAEPVTVEPDRAPEVPSPQLSEAAGTDPDFFTYNPDGQVRSAAIVGDIAWTACGVDGIHAVQLGETLQPLSITPTQGEAFHVATDGKLLYAAESSGGLGIYRIGENQQLTEIGRLKLKSQNIKQVSCPPPGKFAIFHCGSAQVQIADVSDPGNPGVVLKDSQVGLFYGDQLLPEMLGGRYLVAHWHRSGPAWYDISGDTPTLLGNTPSEQHYSWTDGACALGDQLLIVRRSKLQVLDPGEMRPVEELPASNISGVRLAGRPSASGDRLALSRRHEQLLQVLDISDLESPRLLREFHLEGHPGAAVFWNEKLVVPAGYQGLLLER